MYSIKSSFKKVYKRLNELYQSSDIHSYESFLIASFVTEKLIRRTIVKLMIDSGLTKDDAFEEIKYCGISKINEKKWPKYSKNSERLDDVLSKDWKIIEKVFYMRNHLVHGDNKIPSTKECNDYNQKLIDVIPNIRKTFKNKYSFSGWKNLK